MDEPAEQTPSRQEGSTSARAAGVASWAWLVFFVLLYLLGSGPAARLDARGITCPWIYEKFYWPLVSVAQSSVGQSIGLGRLLDWYIMDIWKPYPPEPPSQVGSD